MGHAAVLQNTLVNVDVMDKVPLAYLSVNSTKASIGSDFQSSCVHQARSSPSQSMVCVLCKKLLPILKFVAKIARRLIEG